MISVSGNHFFSLFISSLFFTIGLFFKHKYSKVEANFFIAFDILFNLLLSRLSQERLFSSFIDFGNFFNLLLLRSNLESFFKLVIEFGNLFKLLLLK